MNVRERFEKMMLAVTFAEAGEHETAREMVREERTITRRVNRLAVRTRPRKRLYAPTVRR